MPDITDQYNFDNRDDKFCILKRELNYSSTENHLIFKLDISRISQQTLWMEISATPIWHFPRLGIIKKINYGRPKE